MKWLLRIIFVIFLAFTGVCGVGFFLPSDLSVERSTEINAYPEDVFPYLNNLQVYSQWSPLLQRLSDAELVYGGADSGVGQSLAWQNGDSYFSFGSQEIIQSEPGEFVQVKLNLSGRQATATHAILANEGNSEGPITVITRVELPLGGFPYLQRVRAHLARKAWEKQFDAGLGKLKNITETSVTSR